MAKASYTGYIPALRSTPWYVEIWVKSEQDTITAPRELRFPAEDALTIEWEEMPPEQVMQSSSARLRVISMFDREFVDLYAYKPGDVTLRVYKCGSTLSSVTLYWQGTLDPEFYEEPYESAQGYTVEFTFTDFGSLNRIDYDLKGLVDLDTLIKHILEQAGFMPDWKLLRTGITTSFVDSDTPLKLSDLACDSANWYNEDGKPSTLEEVLRGVLQPLALHITQQNGKVCIYDTDALYQSVPRAIHWSSDSQTLAAAETYNKVKVTFSAYADGSIGLPDYEYTAKTSPSLVNFNAAFPKWLSDGVQVQTVVDYGLYFTYDRDYRKYDTDKFPAATDRDYRSFTIFINNADKAKNLTVCQAVTDDRKYSGLDSGDGSAAAPPTDYPDTADEFADFAKWPRPFKVVPLLDASEEEGVAVSFVIGRGTIRNSWKTDATLPKPRRIGIPCDQPWGTDFGYVLWRSWIKDNTQKQSQFDYILGYMRHPFSISTTDGDIWKDADNTPIAPARRGGMLSAYTAEQMRICTLPPVTLPPPENNDTPTYPGGSTGYGAQSPFMLKLSVDMLLDPRYNPYNEGDNNNEKGHTDFVKGWSRWVFAPFTMVLKNAAGVITHYYSNRQVWEDGTPGLLSLAHGAWLPAGKVWAKESDTALTDNEKTGGTLAGASYSWKQQTLSDTDADDPDSYFGQAWLAWYSADEYDHKDDKDYENVPSGITGWQTNRHCIGRPDVIKVDDRLPYLFPVDGIFYESFKKLSPGQYIPYPPAGGTIEVTLYRGIIGHGAEDTTTATPFTRWHKLTYGGDKDGDKNTLHAGVRGIYNLLRWYMFKGFKLEVIRGDKTFDRADMDDIEFTGWLNKNAHEELNIDTQFGTSETDCPTAKGFIRKSSDGSRVVSLKRAGVTAQPERLLIGSLCSQYASRRTTLSGEAQLLAYDDPDTGLTDIPWQTDSQPLTYTDANHDEWFEEYGTSEYAQVFYTVSRTENLMMMTADITMTTLLPDHFTPEDIKDTEE